MNKDAMTEKLKSGRYMSCEDLFALMPLLDEYECKSYSDEDKREIINIMEDVFTFANDPLAAWLEDILATAQWREARVFPYEDSIYVRVEVKLLDANAEWRGPYQLLVVWHFFRNLVAWTFVSGESKESFFPDELFIEENEAMRRKRMELRVARMVTH